MIWDGGPEIRSRITCWLQLGGDLKTETKENDHLDTAENVPKFGRTRERKPEESSGDKESRTKTERKEIHLNTAEDVPKLGGGVINYERAE